MKRVMTTVYVDPEQIGGLRKTVFELKKAGMVTATQADLVRVGIDMVLHAWRKTEQREVIFKAVVKQKQ